ncbi:ArsR/SmtB family transcription factor [Cohnella nanjingensis]|uniref:Winged helix-turn-helix transcriptional regulator n=1 Tax=Cohnella nanjingensis TaxID=1387779 RepID=A0A7X0RN66_9BACL|nr:metalloregulator ArsR/SmtB family transcription factor [Cohnella nanjingensis]MBB6670363.1 winged helix-turn-helix transcriptional regulator [Cohnella nanjingensis]
MDHTILSALAEPRRLQIVELLQDGPLTVGEIADHLQIRQPQASKHLRILYEAGVVDFDVDVNRRIYRLRPEPFVEINAWLEQYRGMREEKLDNLDDYLQQLQNKK